MKFNFSGTIIARQWIVTAAHCFDNGRFKVFAILNENDLESKDSAEYTVESQNIIIHPKYRAVPGRGGHNGKRTIRTIFCATKFQLYRSIKRTAQNCIENIEKKTQKLQNLRKISKTVSKRTFDINFGGEGLVAAAKWRSRPVLTKASKAKRPSQPLTKH